VSNLSTKVDQTATGLSTEVAAREQTDASLSELSTRVTQTETGITTEISDRKQAVSDAQTAAVNAANANTATMIRQYSDGVLVAKTGDSVGALVSAGGSFDVVPVTWSGSTPKTGAAISSFQGDNVSFFGGMSECPTTSISNDGVYVDSNGGICVGTNAAIFGEKFGYDDAWGGKYRFAVYDDGIYSRGRKVPAIKVVYDNSACTKIGSVGSSVWDQSSGHYTVGDYSWADFVVVIAGKGYTSNFGSVVLPLVEGISGSISTENHLGGSFYQMCFATVWLHKADYIGVVASDFAYLNADANGTVTGGGGDEVNDWVIRQVIGVKL
jgi:hypothetical protein